MAVPSAAGGDAAGEPWEAEVIFDSFPLNDELDLLECRLTELQDVPDLVHVLVEANVTHQDTPKPYHYLENAERFAPWKDRIVAVHASGLPSKVDAPDPWAREHAQREFVADGLKRAFAQAPDVVLHGDVDEIPSAVAVRNVRPRGYTAFDQALYCFAVDWLHPERWRGTVAARVGAVRTFSAMRDARNTAPCLPNAGWHLSWLGGNEAQRRKLESFCHPEIAGRVEEGLAQDVYYQLGLHVDGKKMIPVAVDASWPKWIAEGRCPASWYRPRAA